MSEKYSVEAVLSVVDRGFTSTVGKAESVLGGLKNMSASAGNGIKNLTGNFLGAQLAAQGIMKGLSMVASGATSMVGEINNSSKAWQTFEANEKMLGRTAAQIDVAKKSMQDYATKTVYSASDMASTYAQLDAVGIKTVDKLVTGFGGLAAASENPAQAMKTLSTQAVQMAAKPEVAWADFKLMLEQTPAGISAVAKEMGMSTAQMVTAVQDGSVKTEKFFEAIKKVGNNDSFTNMATQFKTVDQAIDGLKDALANKLMPAFSVLTTLGIKGVNAIGEMLDGVDFSKLSKYIEDSVAKVKAFLKSIANIGALNALRELFKSTFSMIGALFDKTGVKGINFGTTIGYAIKAVANYLSIVVSKIKIFITQFANTGALTTFTSVLSSIKAAAKNVFNAFSSFPSLGTTIGNLVNKLGSVVKSVANFIAGLRPETIQTIGKAFFGIVAGLTALTVGFKAFKAISSLKGIFDVFKKNPVEEAVKGTKKGGSIFKDIFKGIADVAKTTFTGISNVIKSLGPSIATAAKGIGSGFKTAFEGISTIIKSLGPAISTAAQGIGKGISIALKGLAEASTMMNPVNILAFAAAIGLVVLSFAVLATQGDGISKIFQGIGTAIGTVISAIGGVFVQIIGAIANAMITVAPIATVLATAFGIMATSLATSISQIIVAATPLLTVFIQTFPQIITAVTTGVAQIVTALNPIIAIFSQIIVTISNSIVQIVAIIAPVVVIVSTIISQIITTVVNGLNQIVSSIVAIVSQISPIIDSFSNLFKTFGDNVTNVLNAVKGIVDSVGGAISKVLDSIANIFTSIGTAALNAGMGFNLMAQGVALLVSLPLVDMVATFKAVATGLTEIGLAGALLPAVGAGMMAISSSMSNVAQSVMIVANGIVMFTTVLTNGMQSLPSLAQGGMAAIVSAFSVGMAELVPITNRTFSQLLTDFTNSFSRYVQIAQAGMRGLVTELTVGYSNAISLTTQFITQIDEKFQTLETNLYNSGIWAIEGFIEGMQSKLSAVQAIASQIANAVPKSINSTLDINSPSRVTGESGYWTGAGFVNNIADWIKRAGTVGSQLANSAAQGLDNVSYSMSNFNSSIPSVAMNSNMNSSIENNLSISNLLNKLDAIINKIEEGKVMKLDDGTIAGATKPYIDRGIQKDSNIKRRHAF